MKGLLGEAFSLYLRSYAIPVTASLYNCRNASRSPISTTTSSNFGPEPLLVVKFMTADPGEAFADFSYRTEHPGKTQWGQRGDREHKTELILDRNSAARLVDMLSEYLRDSGRT